MATTITQGFTTLSSRLALTGLQQDTVALRQKSVRSAVAGKLDTLDSFLTGSYRRSTLIAPLSAADVDIVVVLDPKYHPSGARNVLERTKNALLSRYETPKVSRNGQAVTITFKDFTVDVVPALQRRGGGYLICNSGTNTFISTDPKRHVDLAAERNRAHNGDLVPVVKMLKSWNRSNSTTFRSFHLEVLAWQVFNNVNLRSYPAAVRYFFDKSRATIGRPLEDPAGYGGNIASYLTVGNQRLLVSHLDTALARALHAERHEAAGNTRLAFGEWRKVFGDKFPAYG